MAVTADVTRGALGVAGGPFGLLLPRSQDFQELAFTHTSTPMRSFSVVIDLKIFYE